MGKAVVIKNANFEDNRVAQVTFDEVIHCTSVAFSENAYNISSMETGTQISVTTIPEDTTDELVLTVADQTVAKIVNGSLFAVGYGETTITATCGNATATATVTVSSLVFVPQKFSEGHISNATSWGDVNPLQYTNSQYYDCFCAEKTTPATTPDGITGKTNIAVIMIPANTAKVRIESDTLTGWTVNVRYASTDTTLNYGGNYYAKYISNAQKSAAAKYTEFTDMPASANSFALDLAHDASDYTMTVTFTPAAS